MGLPCPYFFTPLFSQIIATSHLQPPCHPVRALAESLLDFRDISDLEAWLKDSQKSNDLKPQVDMQNGNQLDV
ncbi:hypothetical protein [Cylindrospermopsis raciborskii]|uniref:DUF4351 domain-containing protein n=1 Tax=Cylindrospermopsis raciborskii CS-505 TaxID=533240 RepID=A0A853MH98_9CYAN|nr:hypothetical protein [Cylindrospermopsis raciborskii]OBU76997.1 hypothetical protein A9P98_12340 [Cylindrospermopsis raciborskii CS-505]